MKKLFACLALFVVFEAPVGAAPLSRNLGQGLAYHRVHQLPGDLPTDESERRQPCILDLRYVDGTTEAVVALSAWLKFHATARAPVFVLANSETSGAVLSVITSHNNGTAVVVIGAATSTFTPDIALKVSAADERRAYDALEHGSTADALINENPNKPRNDEAKLAKERQTPPDLLGAPGDPAAVAPPPSPTDLAAQPKPPAPLMDAVLQRAVQLHRTLVALKKL